VNEKTVDYRINESLPEMILGYKPRHIFNADETAHIYSLMQDKDWTLKGVTCAGHKPKQQLTILLCCNANITKKLKLLLSGKYAKPTRLKNVDNFLSMQY
jgi:centromere protein B